ncbi:MAG: prepilin-type N-terminal cleavage/methylation domain-containing protein [Candidatus Omnitrophica bacterium]|nr:prepilin-type N-terminal cleavage/methylation domain-containing protein [Candidatus Omnitrophota bacterium]MCM8798616.1 prepilin-type N-terminal cleavage/methylation domain-containing protein [Candidatus Omnitrophota bacterium]
MRNWSLWLRENKGFSFLEVLISTVILSILVLIFYTLLWTGTKISKRSREIAEKYAGARVVLEIMAKELRSAFPFSFREFPNFVLESGGEKLIFWNTVPDEMEVRAQYPFQFYRIHYYMDKLETGEDVLYKKIEPFPPGEYEEFSGPVFKAKFKFLVGETKKIDKEEWDEPVLIPEAVKIILQLEEGNVLERVVYLPYAQKF